MTPKCTMKKIKVGKYEKEWLGNSGQVYPKSQGRSPREGNIWVESWVTRRKWPCQGLGAENLSRRAAKDKDPGWE